MRMLVSYAFPLGFFASLVVATTVATTDFAAHLGTPSTPVRPLVTWWGAHSRASGAAANYLRIVDAEDWRKLWQTHAGEDVDDHVRAVTFPDIDFERCMVVAVFAGDSVNTAGVAIQSITDKGNRLVVRFDQIAHSSQGKSADSCRPFALALLPASRLPLVFEEDVRDLKDETPVWKERARLE